MDFLCYGGFKMCCILSFIMQSGSALLFFVDKIGERYFSLYPVTSYGKITISLCKLEVKGKRFSL